MYELLVSARTKVVIRLCALCPGQLSSRCF